MTVHELKRPSYDDEIATVKERLQEAQGALGYITAERSRIQKVHDALSRPGDKALRSMLEESLEMADFEIDEAEESISAWKEILERLTQRSA